MKIDHVPNIAALRRDWLAARIVAVLGGLLILTAAVFAGMALWSARPPAPQAEAPAQQAAPHPTLSPAQLAQAHRAEGIALCDAALAAAQKIGVVPGFAVRASDDTAPAPQGRYTCAAKTDASSYAITFDLACPRLADGCIVPYAVTQDGAAVYQRK
jgi:hypothetical protein